MCSLFAVRKRHNDVTGQSMTTDTHDSDDIILMAHGGGGALTGNIIKDIILQELGNEILDKLDDGACLTIPESELVLTTDSYVVDPIFFPGGDIGKLAVCGTVNDMAMQGAEPKYISLALILEEGLPIRDLKTIIHSVKEESAGSNVLVVTGDTKVVERGKGGGVFINTTGIGVRQPEVDVAVSNAKPGDAVIVTGTIGDHGMAIMNLREGLQLKSQLTSDVASMWSMIKPLLDDVPNIHCLRDPTRGGVAAALCDIAEASSCSVRIRESALPVKQEVNGACSILGLEPLNVANEGKVVIICDGTDTTAVVRALHSHPLGQEACVIGNIVADPADLVILETRTGGERIVTIPAGEDLPRIC